jgi:hypothetical protein
VSITTSVTLLPAVGGATGILAPASPVTVRSGITCSPSRSSGGGSVSGSVPVSGSGVPPPDDGGFSSVMHCLVAAIEGLPPDVVAVEVAYGGFVSGTYPLAVVAMNHEQVAAHAVNTAAAIREAMNGG